MPPGCAQDSGVVGSPWENPVRRDSGQAGVSPLPFPKEYWKRRRQVQNHHVPRTCRDPGPVPGTFAHVRCVVRAPSSTPTVQCTLVGHSFLPLSPPGLRQVPERQGSWGATCQAAHFSWAPLSCCSDSGEQGAGTERPHDDSEARCSAGSESRV